MKSTTMLKFSFLFLTTFNLNYSFAQNLHESIPTIESTNQKISTLQSKIESVSYRINQLKNQSPIDTEQYNYIANLEKTKLDLERELTCQENIKISIQYSIENNLIQNKKSNQTIEHIYKSSQKTIIKQVDFNALSEDKKNEILANPNQYEIAK